ncbi:hypothetical protein GCM10010201_17250 [Pilimelia columellifera subsp. columellifera]|uniref:Uncharacterized protein n=1 Tax=Pilimelia columellifera subsp. columellifera TaxID=706583 RepID=A0ABP6AQ39_9ACTN
MGEHAGLAGAGARDDEQRRAMVDDRGALGIVQPVQQRIRVGDADGSGTGGGGRAIDAASLGGRTGRLGRELE